MYAEDKAESHDDIWTTPPYIEFHLYRARRTGQKKMQSASSMIKGLIETEPYHLNFKEPKDHPTRKSSGRNKPHRIELQSAYYGRIIFRYLKIEHYQLTMPGNTSSEIHGDWRYDEFLLKL